MRLPAWIERLLLFTGIVLLGTLVYALDASTVLADLRQVGVGVVLIVAQEIFAITANATAWRLTFPAGGRGVPFRSVLAARLAGDAVNYLTPTATVGGEFVRVRMLLPYLSASVGTASVAVARLSQTVGLIGFLGIGLWAVLPGMPLSPDVLRRLELGLLAFTLLVGIAVVVQRRGMFGAASRLAARLGIPLPESLHEGLTRLDGQIRHAYRDGASPFLLSAACFGVGWFGGVLENYVALWLLGLPASLEHAIAIEVISVAFDTLVFFVPLGLGTQEAGKVLAFSLLGLPPAKGLALGLLSRIRQLFWALVGLALLARRHLRPSDARESAERPGRST